MSPRERIAEPGGPIKTILFLLAARESGRRGFSDAWPLERISDAKDKRKNAPSSPYSMNACSLCDIDNQIDICIIVVV